MKNQLLILFISLSSYVRCDSTENNKMVTSTGMIISPYSEKKTTLSTCSATTCDENIQYCGDEGPAEYDFCYSVAESWTCVIDDTCEVIETHQSCNSHDDCPSNFICVERDFCVEEVYFCYELCDGSNPNGSDPDDESIAYGQTFYYDTFDKQLLTNVVEDTSNLMRIHYQDDQILVKQEVVVDEDIAATTYECVNGNCDLNKEILTLAYHYLNRKAISGGNIAISFTSESTIALYECLESACDFHFANEDLDIDDAFVVVTDGSLRYDRNNIFGLVNEDGDSPSATSPTTFDYDQTFFYDTFIRAMMSNVVEDTSNLFRIYKSEDQILVKSDVSKMEEFDRGAIVTTYSCISEECDYSKVVYAISNHFLKRKSVSGGNCVIEGNEGDSEYFLYECFEGNCDYLFLNDAISTDDAAVVVDANNLVYDRDNIFEQVKESTGITISSTR